MNKKEMVEWLKDVPDTHEFVLSRVHAYPFKPSELSDDEKKEMYPDGNIPAEDEYNIVLDIPIIGVMVNDATQEIKFVLRPKDVAFLETQFLMNPDVLRNFKPIDEGKL